MSATPEQAPLRSVHSTTFPELLDRFGITVAVTTYQAGKLVLLRADEGKLNTHFRTFRRPMGLAYRPGRLAVGTMTEVWDFHNVPEVAAQLEPAGRHDACFLPRSAHFTGDILVHEMAWAGAELWVVNTGGVASNRELCGHFKARCLKSTLSSSLSLRQLLQIDVEHLAPQLA